MCNNRPTGLNLQIGVNSKRGNYYSTNKCYFFISTRQFFKKCNATYEQKYLKIRVPHAIRGATFLKKFQTSILQLSYFRLKIADFTKTRIARAACKYIF